MEYINGNQKGQISKVYDFPIAAITNYYKQWLKTTQFSNLIILELRIPKWVGLTELKSRSQQDCGPF